MGRHKVATGLVATAVLALGAAIGIVEFYPGGPGLETFLEPATEMHREAEKLLESNQPKDALDRCRQAIAILDQVPARFHDDEGYQFERGAAFETLGLIHTAIDQPEQAVDDYRQTLDIWTKLIARDQHQIELRRRTAVCTARLAPIFVKLGRWEDAQKTLDRGESVCQIQVMGSAPDPRIDEIRVEILNQRGLVSMHKGEWTEALEQFTSAERLQKGLCDLLERLVQPNWEMGKYSQRLIVTLINKAKAHTARNRPTDAEQALIDARDLAEQLRADYPATIPYQDLAATILDTLAELIKKDPKRISEVRGLLERSLSIREKYAANPSCDPEYVLRLAETCSSLGELFVAEKSFKEAEALERKALLYSARLEKQHPSDLEFRFEHGRSLHNLADFLRERGRPDEALPLERQAVERLVAVYKENVLEPDHRRAISYAYWTLCSLELNRGDHRAAAAVIDEYQKIEPGGYEEAYESARFLCRLIPLCRQDQGKPATERESIVRSYADRAIAALETASHHGFHDLNELTTSHIYDPIRGRPEFARVVQHVAAIVEALKE